MKSFIQLVNEKKADKNRKEFEYAKSKESKTFKGTVTQGADKGRNYTITRNPPPKGIDKNLNKAEVKLRDAKSGRNMKTGRLDPISQDLGKRGKKMGFSRLTDRKMVGARKVAVTKNQFWHARSPREGILEIH